MFPISTHLEWIKVSLDARVVVDAALVTVEIVVHLKGHGEGPCGDQVLQHGLFVASSVISAHVDVLADVGAGAGRVRYAQVILRVWCMVMVVKR